MNISRCISQLIMQLGLYNITLPFKNDTGDPIPTENILRDVFSTATIPTYSQFNPDIKRGTIKLDQLKAVDKDNGIYLLPAYMTLTPVLYVVDITPEFTNQRGIYGGVEPSQGVLVSQAFNMLVGQMRAEPSFDYLGFNKIKLYGYPNTNLTFTVACEHDSTGETIADSCYDSFMELATLDVKMFLYNNLKYYDGIPTAFGEIKLRIDDYQGAESERTQLLDRWRDTFHLDINFDQFM